MYRFRFLGFGRSTFAGNLELSKIVARSAWLLHRIRNYVPGDFLRFGAVSNQTLRRLVSLPLRALRRREPESSIRAKDVAATGCRRHPNSPRRGVCSSGNSGRPWGTTQPENSHEVLNYRGLGLRAGSKYRLMPCSSPDLMRLSPIQRASHCG